MPKALFQQKLSAVFLLIIIFAITYFFVLTLDDPTKQNISNNSRFNIESAYLVAPLTQSFSDILGKPDEFVSANLTTVPWDFQQRAYWLKMIISNSDDQAARIVAHFDNPMLDHLTIFQMSTSGVLIEQQDGGDQQANMAFEERIIPHFHFQIPALDSTILYARIATSGIALTPIKLYEKNNFSILTQKMHLLWGIFIGVAIIIGLYNLAMYFSIKDNVYLIYNGYVLSCVAFMGILLGYGFYLFPESIQLNFNQKVIAFNCLMLIFTQLFLVYFLKFQSTRKWHYWLSVCSIMVTLLLFLASLWIPEYLSAPLFYMLRPAVYLICLILLLVKARSCITWGKYYIFSWFPLLIGTGVQSFILTGEIEYTFLSQHILLIAILMEMVLMAMALADRIGFQKRKALFSATHEVNSGLPNKILLGRKISELLADNKTFATCLIQISNYQLLAPYITHNKLQKLESQVVSDITPLLEEQQGITFICNADDKETKLAKVRDGHLMFIFETADRAELSAFLNQLQKSILKELKLEGLLIELKTKIGICFSVEVGLERSANEFIQYSLLAIEQNRESDDHLHYYHDLEILNVKEHLSLACDLQAAIRGDKLALYHQPQIDLHKGNVSGSEALLRWQHPVHGFISPELFVAIAENTGLINELTRWVIDKAFRQVVRLRELNHLGHKVSINISGKDIVLPNFLSYVKLKMSEFNIPRDVIIFELTESVMVSDYETLNSLMAALRKIGINLSIDDYGTGYSSLAYISQLKFDELKIDKAFILDLDRSSRNLTIVKTTIEMAKHLNLVVVAEGVESKSIEQRLIDTGCDIGQGYYYTQPLDFEEYISWMANYKNDRVVTPQSPSSTRRSIRAPARQLKPN